jgi:hypothetical protein
VPDELTGSDAATSPPTAAALSPTEPAPPVGAAADAADARPPRRPSWLRAALLSLIVIVAGGALGAAGYRLDRSYSIKPPAITRSTHGWTITGRRLHEFSGLGMNGPRLVWREGASIEYVHLGEGTIRVLGPGPGMYTAWDPAIGPRYAVWFEAERQASVAAQAVVYDTQSGRRWTAADIGSVRSYPAISGDVAVWCSARTIGVPSINGMRVGLGETFDVAPGDGAPVVAGDLVAWATSWTGPFVAADLAGGTTWPVVASLTRDKLTGIALAGRTLVWGQGSDQAGSGVVAAVGVDGGGMTTLASGLSGLAGPAYDGTTVVWAQRIGDPPHAAASAHPFGGFRVMGRRLGGGPAFLIAQVAGTVSEVAVSDGVAAWIASGGGSSWIQTTTLPR